MIYQVLDNIRTIYEKKSRMADVIQSILLAVCFFALFPPRMVLTYRFYIQIDLYFKLIVVAYICILALCYVAKYKKISMYVLAISFYCAALVLSTFINHGDIKVAIWGNGIIAIALSLLVWISMERDAEWSIKTFYVIYYIAILINFYFVLKIVGVGRTRSFERTFFFGNFNGFIQWFLPAQLLGYILYKKTESKVIKMSYFLLCILNLGVIFYVESMTSMIVLSIFDIYMLLLNKKKIGTLLNIYIYILSNILFFVGIVILRVKVYGLTYFVSAYSGRTPIWDRALASIKNNLLLGVGIEPVEVVKSKLGFSTAHNMGLEILYTGGIVALALFSIIVIIVVVKIVKYKRDDYKLIGCISIFLGCYFLAAQFESHSIKVSVLFFSFVYFILNEFEKGDIRNKCVHA